MRISRLTTSVLPSHAWRKWYILFLEFYYYLRLAFPSYARLSCLRDIATYSTPDMHFCLSPWPKFVFMVRRRRQVGREGGREVVNGVVVMMICGILIIISRGLKLSIL